MQKYTISLGLSIPLFTVQDYDSKCWVVSQFVYIFDQVRDYTTITTLDISMLNKQLSFGCNNDEKCAHP